MIIDATRKLTMPTRMLSIRRARKRSRRPPGTGAPGAAAGYGDGPLR